MNITIEDVPTAQRRLSELKNSIKALGSVNVAAVVEYKEVSERYNFLKTQTDDVQRSRAELLKLIDNLTKQMQTQFAERFSVINQNFSRIFQEVTKNKMNYKRLQELKKEAEESLGINF